MICPECKDEFVEGMLECPDCAVPLEQEILTEPLHDGEELVSVFQTSDASFIPLLKSLLEGSGIPHILQGEHAVDLLPVQYALPVRLLVPQSRTQEVKDLLAHVKSEEADR